MTYKKHLLIAIIGFSLYSSCSWGEDSLLNTDCNRSIQVDADRIVPGDVPVFGGMKCGDLERHRGDIFYDVSTGVDEETFSSLAKWREQRTKIRGKVISARQKIDEAVAARNNDTLKSLAIAGVFYVANAGLNIYACSFGIVPVCIASIVVDQIGTVYGITTINFNGRVDELRAGLEQMSNNLDTIELAETQFGNATRIYLDNFENLCRIVQENCTDRLAPAIQEGKPSKYQN